MNRPKHENQDESRRHRRTSINVADESKDSTNDESKLDYEFANLELGEGTTSSTTTRKARSSTLRRRRYRRGLTSSADSDLNNEERKRGDDDSYSPRDKPGKQEYKEEENDVPPPTSSTSRPPRHSSSSSSLLPHTVNDTVASTNKAVDERKAHTPPPPRTSLPIMHASSNYIRAKPDEKLREKFKKRIRSPADMIPEVHFIGEVSEAEGVGFKDTYVSCKW